eukprot:g16630.t1
MQDARGSTPLHVAALEGHPEITRLLLDSGADPREFKHQSVLDIYLANEVEPEKLKVDVSKIKYKTGKKKKKDSGDKPRAKRKHELEGSALDLGQEMQERRGSAGFRIL